MLIMHYVGKLKISTIALRFNMRPRSVARGIGRCIDKFLLPLVFGVDGISLLPVKPHDEIE